MPLTHDSTTVPSETRERLSRIYGRVGAYEQRVIVRLPADRVAIRHFAAPYGYSNGHEHLVISRQELQHLVAGGVLGWSDDEYTHSIELEPRGVDPPLIETCRFCGLEWLCPECRREDRPEQPEPSDRELLRALVEALPTCDHCGRPALEERYDREGDEFSHWCGDCGEGEPWGRCAMPHAKSLRAAIKRLEAGS